MGGSAHTLFFVCFSLTLAQRALLWNHAMFVKIWLEHPLMFE